MALWCLLTAAVASAAPPEEAPPIHPLVLATEALQMHHLTAPRDQVMQLATMASGLTDEDRARLLLVGSMRSLEAKDQAAARQGIAQALEIDPAAMPPSYAPQPWKELMLDARLRGRSTSPKPDAVAKAVRDAAGREPMAPSLLKVVDELTTGVQLQGAGLVLDLLNASTSLTPSERAQVAVREGIVKLEMFDETSARLSFRKALELDRSVRLPGYAPPKTVFIFADEEKKVPFPAAAAPFDTRPAGLITGGAGVVLVAGGAVAGAIALSSYQGAAASTARGDYDAYLQQRGASKTAGVAANGLWGAGAVALAAGAVLFFRPMDKLSVGVGANPKLGTVAVGGTF